jgi:hypothetical protein
MRSQDGQYSSSPLDELVGELARGGSGRPEDLARRLGGGWSAEQVRAVLGELFSDGVIGHSDDCGFWWVA